MSKTPKFEKQRDELARTLYEFVYGPGTWEDPPSDEEDDRKSWYADDASAILHDMPHLLSTPARFELAMTGALGEAERRSWRHNPDTGEATGL